MVQASRAWIYVHTRCMTFLRWHTSVSIASTVSTSEHTVLPLPALTQFQVAGIALGGMEGGIAQDIMRSSHCRISP